MNEWTNSTGRAVKIGRIPQILLWEDVSCSSEPHFRLACNHFSNAPWVLTGSSALHCKCLALVLSLALRHSWFTYSLFIAFWALSPGSSALGWTGFSLLILKYSYVSAGKLHLQWAGLTWCGLKEKKNENVLHALDSFLREKAVTSRKASCIEGGFLMSGSTSPGAQRNWLSPDTRQRSHCEIYHCLVFLP